jgi:dipeptidyl aminopeptidase/acylaminoacyl peptidase
MIRRPRLTHGSPARTILPAVLTAALACGGDGTVDLPPPPGPSTGSIAVSTSTSAETGNAVLDPDGYTVTVDGLDPHDIGLNGSVTFTDIAAGDHHVAIQGLQVNCTTPDNPIRITVVGGATAQASFDLQCLAPTTGRIAFSASPEEGMDIYTINANGTDLRRLTHLGAVPPFGQGNLWPAWSPDGWKIAYTYVFGGEDEDIWVMNADGTSQTPLTSGHRRDRWPAWSPDGSKIAFASDRDGDLDIYVMNADGTDQVQLTNDPRDSGNPMWHPDGSKIVFWSERDGRYQVYAMNADGSGQVNLSGNEEDDWTAGNTCSPDGSRIAFASSRDGNPDIYVMNVDGSSVTRVTNSPTYKEPTAWSPDGTMILYLNWDTGSTYYVNLDGTVTVPVTAGVVGSQWHADWSHGTGDLGG